MESKKQQKREAFQDAWRTKRSVTLVYILLRASVILVMLAQIFNRNFENVFLCVLTLFLFMVPSMLERKLDIALPNTLEIIILLFIFAAEILGEIGSYYIKYPLWDTMLHTINGFICAAFGFALVDIFNRNRRIKFELSPVFLAIVAFCFSMTIGVLWEFFEFGMDMIFKTDMQKDFVINTISSVKLDPTNSNKAVIIKNITDVAVNGESLGLGGYLDIGLIDTMKDLIVNFIGAVVFSIIGYIYVKTRGKGRFAKRFIPVLEEDGEQSASSEDVLREKEV